MKRLNCNIFKLLAFAATFLVCGIAYPASELANSTFSPRYTHWMEAIKKDGWFEGNDEYYDNLVKKVAATQNSRKHREQRARLKRLMRYCEWLPQCSKRRVYVFRFLDKEACMKKELDEVFDVEMHQYIHGQRQGAYLEGYWDFFFADRHRFGSDCKEAPSERYPRNEAQWRHGVTIMEQYLLMIPSESKIILAGIGLGATTALLLTREMLEKRKRSIDYLITYDMVGPGGYRRNALKIWQDHKPGPAKIRHFYNRWQTSGCLPYDYERPGRMRTKSIAVADQRAVTFKIEVEGGDCSRIWRSTSSHFDMARGIKWVDDIGMREVIKRAEKDEKELCPKKMGCF